MKLRKVTSISVKNTIPKSEVTDINIRTLCQFYHNKLEKVFYTVFPPDIEGWITLASSIFLKKASSSPAKKGGVLRLFSLTGGGVSRCQSHALVQ